MTVPTLSPCNVATFPWLRTQYPSSNRTKKRYLQRLRLIVLPAKKRAGEMAAMASTVRLLERSQFTGSVEAIERSSNAGSRMTTRRLVLRAQQQQNEAPTSRRGLLGLMAAGLAVGISSSQAKAVTDIQVKGPPPPSGGLPGTENADQPRDLDLPLKERFYLQPLTPAEAVTRVKDASKDIVGVKDLIAKKSWPYVRNDLRSKATYLRYDLQTIISSKPKAEAREIKKLSKVLFDTMDSLDYAARSKDPTAAEKSYNDTVAALNDVIAKLS